MSNSTSQQYEDLVSEFEKVIKRILIFKTDRNRKVPTDPNKLLKYKTDLITAYNNFASFVSDVYDNQTDDLQQKLNRDFDNIHKPKVIEALSVIGYTTKSPKNFVEIDTNSVNQIDTNSAGAADTESQKSASTSTGKSTENENPFEALSVHNDSESDLEPDTQNKSKFENSLTVEPQAFINETVGNMVNQTKAEFLKMATGLINYKFSGDPLKLESFLADVEMVEALAEEENKEFCVKFVKAKLEQKALECLPENVEKISDITDALKSKIKTESSDVVDGKILALRLKSGNFSEFAKRAEELADEYRRSLVNEGITKIKAEEMAVKKTIELCRRIANNETVKSVISSTKYDKPSEVLTTFITQCDLAKKEKREADAAKQIFNKNNNFRGKNRGGNRGGNRGQNGQNKDNREQKDNRGQYPSKNGNGYHRGGGSQRGFGRGQYSQPRNEQTIRLVTAQPPQQTQTAQNTQNEQLNEQFFRLAT